MQGLVTGAGWREGSLHLELRDGPVKELVAVRSGEEIAIAFSGRRLCIGYRAPGADSLLVCPDGAPATEGNQCAGCLEQARIIPCLRCDGEVCRNPARRPTCVQPDNHGLYLASFGHGIIKVGVAGWERRSERIAEQGARAAIVIARDDGQLIRRAESQAHSLKIPDKISPTQKLAALTQRGVPAELTAELLDCATVLRQRMRAAWIPEPEIVKGLVHPPILRTIPRVFEPADGASVRGRIITVIGSQIVIDSDRGDTVALDARAMSGWQVSSIGAEQGTSGQISLAVV